MLKNADILFLSAFVSATSQVFNKLNILLMTDTSRRYFFRKLGVGLIPLSGLQTALPRWLGGKRSHGSVNDAVYFTTGFKIMEVTEHSALIWTRLCAQEKPNPVTHERREQVFRHPVDFNEDQPVHKMDGAVNGSAGWVRMTLSGKEQKRQSAWTEAVGENDYTVKHFFDNLTADHLYTVDLQARASSTSPIHVVRGTFKTAPSGDAVKAVNLVTSTCQYFWSFDDDRRGFKAYDNMRKLKPDFYIHTGDYVYYDKPGPLATNIEKARHKWHAMDSWPSIRALYEEVPLYMIKDDHDLLKDDAYRGISPYGQLTFEEGLRIW